MRVLFVTSPEKTIFLSMVPMAWALRTAGHEVRVASRPGFANVITQAGLTAVPAGRDTDLWRRMDVDTELAAALCESFNVPLSLLVPGTNVVAVSTHIDYRATPDMSFDMSMQGVL